ncbi:MAG: DUF2971 domain-containing protein [Prosthecobacter sp.]
MSSSDAKRSLMQSFAQPVSAPSETKAFFEQKHLLLPPRLYQYRPVKDSTIEAIRRQAVWMQGPLDFNDLYDSAFSVHLTLHENAEQEARQIFAADGGYSEEEANHQIAVLMKVVERSRQRIVEDVVNGTRNSLKIACFSEVADSLLMWAHYAASHQGYVIEYDMTDLSNQRDIDFARMLFPVVYGDQFSGLIQQWDFVNRPANGSDIHYPIVAACYKASEWSYEREWRAIIGHGAMAVNSWCRTPSPSRVILGARMPDNDRNRLIDLLAEKNIRYTTASFAPDSFQMIIAD